MASALSRIVVTRRLPTQVLAGLRARAGTLVHVWDSEEPMPRSELLAALRAGDARETSAALVCTLSDRVDEEVLTAHPALHVVSTLSVGYSHVDVAAAVARRIRVAYTPDVLTETTADLVLALTLATCRRVLEAADAVRSGEWSAWKLTWMCGKDLFRARVGIVGLGRIGVRVAVRLRGFDCSIAYTGGSGPKPDMEAQIPGGAVYQDLPTLMRESDVVIVLCALTPSTRGLITHTHMTAMREDAVLINAARGEVLDQDALVEVLRARPSMRAGLDVTTPEPLPPSHPLLTLPNCTVTPHIGSASVATRATMASMAAAAALDVLDGKRPAHEIPETRAF